MQSERDEMEYYGYKQKYVILCKDCKEQQVCKVAQYLGNEGYCSRGERKDNELV